MHRPTLLRLGLTVGAVVLVLTGSAFGRAEPTGNYRPPLSPDALTNGCYPLADGIELDVPAQVRSDGDHPTPAGVRRVLVLHWDELDEAGLVASLDRSLEAAGYARTGDDLVWTRGDHRVTAVVTPFPDVPDDSLVRGQLVLQLPVTPLSSSDPICADPYSTKRFPADEDAL